MIIKLNENENTLAKAIEKQEDDIKDAKKELDADVYSGDGDIERALNRSLRVCKNDAYSGTSSDYPNILFVGAAGSSKSARVRAWAQKNNINLYEVRAAGMDPTDLGGAMSPKGDVAKRLSSVEFDWLEQPNSVLFLDEYNRAPREVRTNLLELVNSHVVPDARVPGGQRKLKNFLFTVAAINPANYQYDTDETDVAENSRFRKVNVQMDKINYLSYLNDTIDKELKNPEVLKHEDYVLELERKRNLINTIIPNKNFQLDGQKETADMLNTYPGEYFTPTNTRTFKALLKYCDGTKEDFLDLWSDYCNPLQKKIIETILKDYKDIDDKASQLLNKYKTENELFKDEVNAVETENSVFKKSESASSKLNKLRNRK